MTTQWIAVDWGTTNLRAWVFGDEVVALSSDRGMGALAPWDFEPALLDLIGDYLPDGQTTPIIACGMVGAKQGWAEAPYGATPCKAPGMDDAIRVATADPRLDMRILPGISQAQPADVMRGEETQIGGFLADNPKFDGVICLPGTHCKWAHISAEEIVSFRTVMTGELFALLADQSVLRHSVNSDGWDEPAFLDAVSDAMSFPQRVTSKLFALRAEDLLTGATAATQRARLSGYLIGLELSGTRDYWLGQNVALIGAPDLCAKYAAALAAQGVAAQVVDSAPMVLKGLTAAYESLQEDSP